MTFPSYSSHPSPLLWFVVSLGGWANAFFRADLETVLTSFCYRPLESFCQTTFTLDLTKITDSSTGFALEWPHASIVLAIVVGASTSCWYFFTLVETSIQSYFWSGRSGLCCTFSQNWLSCLLSPTSR